MKGNPLRHPLIIVTGASVVSATFFAGRWAFTGTPTYGFLIWNLILAWVPLFFAWLASRWRHYRLLLLSHAGLWLLFLPNAPYLLTDLIHLGRWRAIPLWYDLLMLLVFAATGLLLGFFSLNIMQDLVVELFGLVAGRLFAVASLALCSFGVYLGRFLRWNSWDLLAHPYQLWSDILALVSDPLRHWQPWIFILVQAAVLWLGYALLAAIRHSGPLPRGGHRIERSSISGKALDRRPVYVQRAQPNVNRANHLL